jgi:hypothetical protein
VARWYRRSDRGDALGVNTPYATAV